MTNTSAMSKEEAFININTFLSNTAKIYTASSDFTIEEISAGPDYLKCFTVSFAKCNNRIESVVGSLMSGSGMIPDMSNESEYHWNDISSNEGAVLIIHQPGVRVKPYCFRYNNNIKRYGLQPNPDYKFSVNVRQYVRLGHPYGQCSSSDPFVQGGKMQPDVPYLQPDCETGLQGEKDTGER